ncbi:MAG TPA: hypothetical protein VG387_08790 [Rhizomicrobium sp.]|jgi:hypothetical protein|nr:hypothetical protein [Rhizomicrobium sp.]
MTGGADSLATVHPVPRWPFGKLFAAFFVAEFFACLSYLTVQGLWLLAGAVLSGHARDAGMGVLMALGWSPFLLIAGAIATALPALVAGTLVALSRTRSKTVFLAAGALTGAACSTALCGGDICAPLSIANLAYGVLPCAMLGGAAGGYAAYRFLMATPA